MAKYIKTNITAKLGVNYVRNIVEESGCIFHKIEQENDLGIDGLIEFIVDEKPVNKSIAIQIKSGQSYHNEKSKECLIPVKGHYEYWKNYPLPVFGLVYIHELKKGYWVDIKKHFDNFGKVSVIKFPKNKTNEFDLRSYNRIFKPFNINEVPEIPLEEAILFFKSNQEDEFILGMVVLFRKYVNKKQVWDLFISFIKENDFINIPSSMIYYLSHIPWHPDIHYQGENISKEIKDIVLEKIKQFDVEIVIKLLSIIDEETGIRRGSIGQSVEAILSKVENINLLFEEIMLNQEVDLSNKHNAALIYAYYKGEESLPFFQKLRLNESWLIPQIIEEIKEYQWINLYG